MHSSVLLFKNSEISGRLYVFLILKSKKNTQICSLQYVFFFKFTGLAPVVTDGIQTRTGSQIQMILHISVTVHAHCVNSMYYGFFEDNENIEKHQKPVLPTATREIQIILHLPLMEMEIKVKENGSAGNASDPF